MELVHSKYDTDHFERRWWEPAYWRLWKAGVRVIRSIPRPVRRRLRQLIT